MDDPLDYGLPGVAALNNPYGLTANAPQVQAPPMLPVMQFALPPAVQAGLRGGYGGGGVSPLPGPVQVAPSPAQSPTNVVPFRATDPSWKQGAAPVIGRDMSLADFTNMQRKKESSGNYQALNKESKGNTASGAYQYTDSTWNNYGGYQKALLAPREIQDRRYAEDLANRVNKYNGDMFKVIAGHYLPAFANDPSAWRDKQRIKVRGGYQTVNSVESYLRHVLKGSPYEKQLDAYLNGQ